MTGLCFLLLCKKKLKCPACDHRRRLFMSQLQQCQVPACTPASPVSRQSIIFHTMKEVIVIYLLSCQFASFSTLKTVGIIARCPSTHKILTIIPLLVLFFPVIFHLSPLSLSPIGLQPPSPFSPSSPDSPAEGFLERLSPVDPRLSLSAHRPPPSLSSVRPDPWIKAL